MNIIEKFQKNDEILKEIKKAVDILDDECLFKVSSILNDYFVKIDKENKKILDLTKLIKIEEVVDS